MNRLKNTANREIPRTDDNDGKRDQQRKEKIMIIRRV